MLQLELSFILKLCQIFLTCVYLIMLLIASIVQAFIYSTFSTGREKNIMENKQNHTIWEPRYLFQSVSVRN